MNPRSIETSGDNRPNSATSERQSSGWDLRNAPKNYLWLVIAQGGSAFLAFASVWLITRTLGSQGYGGIVAVIAASQLIQVLVNWTSVALVRYGVDEFVDTGKIARTFWLRFIILFPNLTLVLFVFPLWFPFLSDWLKLSPSTFWLVALHFLTSALWIHMQFGLQAVKMPLRQGGLLAIERLISFIAVAVLVTMGKLDTMSAIVSLSGAALIMTLVCLWFLRKFIFVRFTAGRVFWRQIVVFSLPLLPSTLTAYLTGGYLDAVFISKFLSISDLGIYSVASQINGLSLQLPTLANSLLLPLFISLQKEGRSDKLQRYFRHNLPTLMLGWGLCSTIAALAFYFLVPAVFGSEFSPAVRPLWILFGGSVLLLPSYIGYGALSNSTSTTYISMVAVSFAAFANVGFNFFLIPTFGMEGCAWATVIMYSVMSVTVLILLIRVVSLPISWVYFAILPGLLGAASISLFGNPWLALAVCSMLTFFVGYWFRSSAINTVNFIRNFRDLNA